MLVFKLQPGERTSRMEIVEIVSERLGSDWEWTRGQVMPEIDSALGTNLVEGADGELQTVNDATIWTLWMEPPEQDPDAA
ncbi:MAG: hypothetical protein V3V67_05800 [Myxococcota bacterium]